MKYNNLQMQRLIIKGEKKLEGSIDVRGSKNAATPIIAATLLTPKTCTLDNVPLVEDVKKMLTIVEELGAEVKFVGKRKVKITAKNIDPKKLDSELVQRMRSSILLIGPLLARFGKVSVPQPGGCVIGSRPINTHINAFLKMGVRVDIEGVKNNGSGKNNVYHFTANGDKLNGREIILDEFSVTATENVMMASCLAKGKTVIKTAAAEPHVQNLADFLRKIGVSVEGDGTSCIQVKGEEKLSGAEHFICHDYIEAGTFIILGLATKSEIEVRNVPVDHLELFLTKMKNFGARLKIKDNTVKVSPTKSMVIPKVQAMPHPGIPTDLQAPLGVLSTQTKGLTLIHDPLYEGRLKYLEELNKMGAETVICDPHRAIISGPTHLHGVMLDPLDLRAGAALLIAGLIAEDTTIIKDISQADRGYEDIDKRLRALGADIRREKAT